MKSFSILKICQYVKDVCSHGTHSKEWMNPKYTCMKIKPKNLFV